jgi:ABC-2 type transport system ATP-binding protein
VTSTEAARDLATIDRLDGGRAAPWAIDTTGLTKTFGSVAVVDDLRLHVPTGSVFGFLGPNGSGKTTTIRMLLGLIAPTAGTVNVLGRPIPDASEAVLPNVGALVEGPACYPWLSGRENLERFDAAGPHPDRATRRARVGEALERVGLTAAAGKKYKAYSLGMRQRLGLASALLRPRRLLVLDEPTNGMDPQGTREIRHLIRELNADGTTVFVSSHLLAEVEQVCTHVAIMSLGRLLAQGSLDELRQNAGQAQLRVDTPDGPLAATMLTARGLKPVATDGHLTVDIGATVPHVLCRDLVQGGVRVNGFVVSRPSLEDLFVGLTGEGFDVAR